MLKKEKQCNILDAYKECGTLETVQKAVKNKGQNQFKYGIGRHVVPVAKECLGISSIS